VHPLIVSAGYCDAACPKGVVRMVLSERQALYAQTAADGA
jgi:hypothetical protein